MHHIQHFLRWMCFSFRPLTLSDSGKMIAFQLRGQSQRLRNHTVGSADRFYLSLFQWPQKPYPVRNDPREWLARLCSVIIPTVWNCFQTSPVSYELLVSSHFAFDPSGIRPLQEASVLPSLPDPVCEGHSAGMPAGTKRKPSEDWAVDMGRVEHFSNLCVKPRVQG